MAGEPSDGKGASWQSPYETLRKKWVEVPDYVDRCPEDYPIDRAFGRCTARRMGDGSKGHHDRSSNLRTVVGITHSMRTACAARKSWMSAAASVSTASPSRSTAQNLTFVDLVETNLKVLERLCKIMGLKDVQFVHLKDLDSLKPLDTDYDVIMAMGSMHHAPMDILKPEYQELLRHLKVGGRWLQLAYPKSRWIRDGRPRFAHWGVVTDGEGTPWAEWLDLEKLLGMLAPAKFDVVLYQEFHNHDFNWFDLLYRGMPDRVHP